MARAAQGFNYARYLALVSQMSEDVERLPPRMLKAYLRRRLHFIDLEIRQLCVKLDKHVYWSTSRSAWSAEPLDEERWTSLANLNYLVAARDALIDAIDSLRTD